MTISQDQTARADDFINESEKDATPANDNGRVAKLESVDGDDAKISNAFVKYGGFGDGSDGDVTISSATTLTKDMYYNNLTVNDTLTTDGYKIFVKGTLDGTGTIDWGTANNGGNGVSDADGGSGGSGGSQSGSGILKNIAGSQGGDGGSSDGTTGGVAGNSADGDMKGTNSNPSIGVNGSDGGNGGGGTGNGEHYQVGGSGGTIVDPNTDFPVYSYLISLFADLKSDYTLTRLLSSGGAGGGGYGGDGSTSDYSGSGGGGGATGGIVFISANNVSGSFSIKAVGGNGGNGSNGVDNNVGGGGGGAGGAGGVSVLVYNTKDWTSSYNLSGGTGGSPGSGATSTATPEDGDDGLDGKSYEVKIIDLI